MFIIKIIKEMFGFVNEIYENTISENKRLVKELTKKVKNNKMDKSLSSNKKEDKIKLLHEQGFSNIRQATKDLGMKAKDIYEHLAETHNDLVDKLNKEAVKKLKTYKTGIDKIKSQEKQNKNIYDKEQKTLKNIND